MNGVTKQQLFDEIAERGVPWCAWRGWSWRRTLSSYLRGRGWRRGEWVLTHTRFRGTIAYWRVMSRRENSQ